jgi:hypothetical protein
MKAIVLNQIDEATLLGQSLSLKSQISYLKKEIVPLYKNMEKWEAKEYQQVLVSYNQELENNINHLVECNHTFNGVLSKYGVSVAEFINHLNNE